MKRLYCLLLAAALIVSSLVGCAGEADKLIEEEQNSAGATEAVKTEPSGEEKESEPPEYNDETEPSGEEKESEPPEHNDETEPSEVEESPIEDFSYEMENGEVTITGYKGVDREIRIPAEIHDRLVTQIGAEAFAGYDMVSVVVPDGVKVISAEAFCNCQCLTNLTLPDTLETIEGGAFKNCVLLECVDLPDGLQYLGGNAFANSGLKRLDIPSDTVFERGTTTVQKTDSDGKVEYISREIINNPIRDCDAYLVVESGSAALEQIELYGTLAIKYKITGLKQEEYFKVYELSDGSVLIEGYSGLDEVVEIPDTIDGRVVTVILDCAFAGSEMKEVRVPESVTFIGLSAFKNCNYLEKIVFEGEGEVKICEGAFANCTKLAEIELPAGARFQKKLKKVIEGNIEKDVETDEPLWPLAEGDQTILIVDKDSEAYQDLISEYNDGKIKFRVK